MNEQQYAFILEEEASMNEQQYAFILGRRGKSLAAFAAYVYSLYHQWSYSDQPTIRAAGGRVSFLRHVRNPLSPKPPRGYSILWHSGKVPPPTMGHHLRLRLTPDRLKALRAA